MSTDNVPARGPVRRILRIMGRAALGLLLLSLLALGATLLWLRSSWSDRVLTEYLPPIINNALAVQGLSLQVHALSGPLPGQLHIKGLLLSDQEGLFLEIPEIDVELHIPDLLGGTATVELARVAKPVLHRLPVLPPAQELPADTPVEEGFQGPGLALDLPVSIQVREFRLDQASIPWSLLGQGTPASRDTPERGQSLASGQPPVSEHELPSATGKGQAPVGRQTAEPAQVPASAQTASAGRPAAASAPAKALAAAQTQPLSVDIRADAVLARGEFTASIDLAIRDTASSSGENLDISLKLSPIKAALSSPQDNAASLEGSLSVGLGELREQADIRLSAGLRGSKARLDTFSFQGLGLRLATEAAVDLDNMRPTATLTLDGQDGAKWQELATALAGLSPELAQALGSPLHIRLELESADDGLQLNVPDLRAGIISGSGALSLEQLFAALEDETPAPAQGDATKETAPGNAAAENAVDSATTGGDIAKAAAPDGTAAENTKKSGPPDKAKAAAPVTLEAEFSFTAADIAPFGPGMGGALYTRLEASGALPDISLTVTARSASLTTPAGELSNVSATATVKADAADDGAVDASGSLRVSAVPGAVGPTDIQADWQFGLPGKDASGAYKGAGQAELRNLRALAFGLELNGAVQARLAPALLAGSAPAPSNGSVDAILWPGGLALDGAIQARIRDWSPLSSLAQTTLQGSEAAADVALAHAEGRQGLRMDLRMDSFAAPQQGVSLSALSAKIDANLPENAGGHPALGLDVRSGKGQAADVAWSEILAQVTGNGPQGDFSVQVKQDAGSRRKGPSSGSKRQNTGKQSGNGNLGAQTAGTGKNRADLLDITGQYSLATMEVSLARLSAREPASGIGVQLRQPASLALDQGIAVHGLVLDFTPGGSLAVDAALKQNSLQADISLAALPLEVLNRLGGTTLPAGRLDAGIVMSSGSRSPEGEILADIRFDKEQPAFTGKKRMSATADGGVRTRNRSGKQEAQAQATAQNAPAKTPQGPADISLNAQLGRLGGRLLLSGGLDFSRLADSLIAAARTSPDDGTAQAGSTNTAAPGDAAAPLRFRIPMLLEDGVPMPDMNAPLDISLQWTGPLDGLWQLVPMPDTELSGLLAMDLAVAGRLSAPEARGSVYVAGGRFNDKGQGVLLTDLALEAHASKADGFSLVASATDGLQGSLGIEGSLDLKDGPVFALRGQIKHLSPLHRDDLDLTLSGIFSAAGPAHAPEVTATIVVERGEIMLLSTLGGGSVRTLPITDPNALAEDSPAMGGTLDVTVEVPRRFYIRGKGMDSEWQGKLHVSGPLSEPELAGSLKPVRGYFELLSKPFAFTGGDIAFVGGSRINPGLNLELTYSGPDLEAVIIAGGSLEKPGLDLQSRPPLPRDEVLAHVLFGKSVSELSRFEALQLANGLRELAGIGEGSLDPLTSMRKATGLDVLRFGGGGNGQETRQDSGMSGADNLGAASSSAAPDEGAPTLEAGKYINDSIYIGVEQGATQESTGVRVEIELFPSITVQGKTTSTSSSAGIGWKMDY